jgi:hypothetical protein
MNDVEPVERERQRVSLHELVAAVVRLRVDVDTGDLEARELVTARGTACATEQV